MHNDIKENAVFAENAFCISLLDGSRSGSCNKRYSAFALRDGRNSLGSNWILWVLSLSLRQIELQSSSTKSTVRVRLGTGATMRRPWFDVHAMCTRAYALSGGGAIGCAVVRHLGGSRSSSMWSLLTVHFRSKLHYHSRFAPLRSGHVSNTLD